MKTIAVRRWNVAINISHKWSKCRKAKNIACRASLNKMEDRIAFFDGMGCHFSTAKNHQGNYTLSFGDYDRKYCINCGVRISVHLFEWGTKMEHAFECVEANLKSVMIKNGNSLILPLKRNIWIGRRNSRLAVLRQWIPPTSFCVSLSVCCATRDVYRLALRHQERLK